MYQRSFFSEDADLTRLWEMRIDPLNEPDDAIWDAEVTRILINAGYSVRK